MTPAARGGTARGSRAAKGVARLALVAWPRLGARALGCHRDRSLGPPDSFAVYAPLEGAAPRRAARRAWPSSSTVAPDDPRAEPLYQQLTVGFSGEVLRTDYLAKQLVREANVGGKRYPDAERARGRPADRLHRRRRGGRQDRAGPGAEGDVRRRRRARRRRLDRAARLPGSGPRVAPDAGRSARVRGRRARGGRRAEPAATAAAGRLRPGAGGDRARVADGGGARGDAAGRRRHQRPARRCSRPCGRTATSSAPTARRARRPTCSRIPGVAATVLYRLAQSKTVGRKIAPAEVYAPFVTDRVPAGVSPAAVLGPFRNFQAKLLSAWGRAVLEGRPAARHRRSRRGLRPRAAGRAGATSSRIFVITTYGATVKPGGVRPPTADPGAACPS